MERFVWDEKFEWLEQEALTSEEIQALPVQEQVQRELKLAKILWAFRGRWVMIKNQDVIASDTTLAGLMERKAKKETADAIIQVPEENHPRCFLADAA